MTVARRAIGLGLLFAALASTAALAQARWYDPYNNGLKALKAGRWQEAITDFEQAIRIDSKAQASKLVEGVFRVDYFPYLYLGQAYVVVGRFQDAEKALKSAAETRMPAALTRELEAAQREAADGLKPTPTATPTPTPTPTSAPPRPTSSPVVTLTPTPVTPTPTATPLPLPVRTIEPPKPAIAPGFVALQTQADTALRAGRYADAAAAFTKLRDLDPAEFSNRSLGARLDEAARGQRATVLVQEGQQRLKEEKYAEARQKFVDANGLVPLIAKNGLAQIDSRESEYRQFVSQGDQFRDSHRLADAVKSYEQAADAQAERYRSENIGARVEDLRRAMDNYENLKKTGADFFKEGKFEAARSNLLDARDIDKARFESEGLARYLTDIDAKLKVVPAPVNPFASTISDALVAYLGGEVDRAIGLLEPAAAGDKDLEPQSKADVHAYLGVAYADRAFGVRDQAERTRFREKALAEFRLALAASPSYQLSNRLGPKVQELLSEAKRK